MDLEIQDHIMSGRVEVEHKLVIAAAANQAVIAGATGDDVVTCTAVESEGHRSSGQSGGIDGIVVSAGLDRKKIAGFPMVDGHLLGQAVDRKHGARGGYIDVIFTGRAINGHALR